MAETSRRRFLLGFGGGIATAAAAFAIWRIHPWSGAAFARYPLPECCAYVDYAGWLLTKADKDRLTAAGSLRTLDGMTLNGTPLEDNTVDNLEACSSWCLSEPECQAFAFGKPSNADEHLRNRCFLKSGGDLTPVPNPQFTSGVR